MKRRSILLTPVAAALVGAGCVKPSPQPQPQALQAPDGKQKDRFDIRDVDGFDGSGKNDNASVIQKALSESAASGQTLHMPSCRPVLGSTVQWPSGARMSGAGESAQGTPATRFLIGHAGVGFLLKGAEGPRLIHNVSTIRQQPEPKAGWEPGDFDYDFSLEHTTDVLFDGVTLYNPTRGIRFQSGGRNDVRRLRMQPMVNGLYYDNQQDVSRIDTIHFWPFWLGHPDVVRWQDDQCTGIISKRNDNPLWHNLFTISLKRAVSIEQGENGTTSKLKVLNSDFDVGATAYSVDASGHTAQLLGVTFQGRNDRHTHDPGIFVKGSNNSIYMDNIRLTRAGGNAIRVDGKGNTVTSGPLLNIEAWDMAAIGFPAVEALSGNTIKILGAPTITGASKTRPAYGGDGDVIVDAWRTWSPTITPRIKGANWSTTQVAAKYRRRPGICQFMLSLVVGDTSGSDTPLQISLPIAAISDSVCSAVDTTGKQALIALIRAGEAQIQVTRDKGEFAAAKSYRIVITGSFDTQDPGTTPT